MGLRDQIDELNIKISSSINFVINKFKDFPHLSLGEQISYLAIGVGFVLIIIAIVMFII